MAKIDPRPGFEIVADTAAGASTQHAGVFTIRSGKLIQMGIKGEPVDPDFGGAGFPYAGSSTHQNAVDCWGGAGSGRIVTTGAGAFHYPRPWKVTRTFYRVEGAEFVAQPSMTKHLTVPYGKYGAPLPKRFPEINDFRAFPGCTEVFPAH